MYGNKIKPTMWVAMIYTVLYENKIYIMLYMTLYAHNVYHHTMYGNNVYTCHRMPKMWVTIHCMEIKYNIK